MENTDIKLYYEEENYGDYHYVTYYVKLLDGYEVFYKHLIKIRKELIVDSLHPIEFRDGFLSEKAIFRRLILLLITSR